MVGQVRAVELTDTDPMQLDIVIVSAIDRLDV